MRLAVALSLVAIAVAACGSPATPAPAMAVPTQDSPAPGTPQACPAALIAGTLVPDARWAIALRDANGGLHKVIWPFGYSARSTDSGVVLLDQNGGVAAIEGDRVELGGAAIDNAGTWLACSGIQARSR